MFTVIPPTVPKLKTSKNLRLRLRSHGGLIPARVRRTVRALRTACQDGPRLLDLSDVCRTGIPRCGLTVSHSGIRLLNLRLGRIFTALDCCVKTTCMGSFIRFKHVCRMGVRTGSRTRGIVSSILRLDLRGGSNGVIPFSTFARIGRRLKLSRVGLCGVCGSTSVAYVTGPGCDSNRTVRTVRRLMRRRLNGGFKCR